MAIYSDKSRALEGVITKVINEVRLTHAVDCLVHFVRFHRSAPVLVEHHEVLLPAVQSREQLLELIEAHLARVVPLVDAWLSFNAGRARVPLVQV